MKKIVVKTDDSYTLYFYAKNEFNRTHEAYLFFHGVPSIESKNEDIAYAVFCKTQLDTIVIHYKGLGNARSTSPQFDFINSVKDSMAFTAELLPHYHKIHLVGHSWGGCVALNVYREILFPSNKNGQMILLAPFTEFPQEVPWLLPMVQDGRIPLKVGIKGADANFFAVRDQYPPKKNIKIMNTHDNQFTIIEAIDDPDVPNKHTTALRHCLEEGGVLVQNYRIYDDHLFSLNRKNIIDKVLNSIDIYTLTV